MSRGSSNALAALRHRNFRLYLAGQSLSQAGTWFQSVAMGWLVLKVTGSGGMLGLVTAAQFIPALLFAPMAGALADRHSRWKMLNVTQVLAATVATTIGVLVATDSVEVWSLMLLAALFGTVNAFDMPIRSSFVYELVGPDDLTQAVGVSSTANNIARIFGPSLAGFLIAATSLSVPFFVNGVSYLAISVSLLLMRRSEFVQKIPAPKQKGQVREGIRIVWNEPRLRAPLLMAVIIGMLAYENQIALPLFAKFTFGKGSAGYGLLSSFMGIGSVVGGLVVTRFGRATHRRLGYAALFLGVSMTITAFMPTYGTMLVALIVVGMGSVFFITMNSATLQLSSPPDVRGRVMALYITALIGTTPIGGPIIGWVGQHIDPRATFVVGGLSCIVTVAIFWRSLAGVSEPVVTEEEAAVIERAAVIEAEDLVGDKDATAPQVLPTTD